MKSICARILMTLTILAAASPALAVEISTEKGSVVGKTDDGRVWKRPVIADEVMEGGKRTIFTTVHQNHVYACADSNIYQLDAFNGAVHWRRTLPGSCGEFEVKGETLTVSAKGTEKPEWTRKYEVTSSGVDMPFHLGNGINVFRVQRVATEVIPSPILEMKYPSKKKPELSPEQIAQTNEAIEELGFRAAADPSNPHYRYWRGWLYDLLGNQEAAKASYDSVFEIAKPYHPELMLLVRQFEKFSPERADRAFDMALGAMLERGFEPRLNLSLVSLMIWLGPPPVPNPEEKSRFDLSDPEQLAKAERHGQRIARFAPRAEASTHFFHALYLTFEGKDKEKAARWKTLRDEAMPYRVIGGPNEEAESTGDNLNIFLASGIVFWVLLLVKLGRSAFDKPSEGVDKITRLNIFNRFDIGESLGLVGVVLLGFWAARKTAMGVAIIGVMASMPIGMMGGTMAHPDAVEFVKTKGGDTPAATFMLALAAQQANDLENAAELYSRLPDNARAMNNLGVIYQQQDKVKEAKAQWTKAKGMDPALMEARYNLGEQVDSPRAITQKKYLPGAALLAVPDSKQWGQLWRTVSPMEGINNPMNIFELSSMTEPNAGGVSSFASIMQALPTFVFMGTILLLLLIGVFKRDPNITRDDKIGRFGYVLTCLTPGASRHWSVVGPFFALAFGVALLSAQAMASSKGMATNILSAIATPAFGRYFGAHEYFASPTEEMWRAFGNAWWVFLVGNLLFVAFMEKLRPDPNGFFANKSK